MISSEEKASWFYLAVKKLCALLKGITSKYDDGFYYLNCFHSFRTENKLKYHEKVCKSKDFCRMSSQKDNILQFNQYMKSAKMPYIYADEYLIKKQMDVQRMQKNI